MGRLLTLYIIGSITDYEMYKDHFVIGLCKTFFLVDITINPKIHECNSKKLTCKIQRVYHMTFSKFIS